MSRKVSAIHFQYPLIHVQGYIISDVKCCYLRCKYTIAKKCDVSTISSHIHPASIQVFNHCSALSLPSISPAGVAALQGNQEVA